MKPYSKNCVLKTRVTPDEYIDVVRRCNKLEMSVSDYLRVLLFHGSRGKKTETDAITVGDIIKKQVKP